MIKLPVDTPGQRLRFVRMDAGISQADFAKQLGYTKVHVSRIERDLAPIDKVVGPAADLLGVTTDLLWKLANRLEAELVTHSHPRGSPSAQKCKSCSSSAQGE